MPLPISFPPTHLWAGSRSRLRSPRIRCGREPRGQSWKLADDGEPGALRNQKIQVGALVVERDREGGSVSADLLVLHVGEADGGSTGVVAALADIRVRR